MASMASWHVDNFCGIIITILVLLIVNAIIIATIYTHYSFMKEKKQFNTATIYVKPCVRDLARVEAAKRGIAIGDLVEELCRKEFKRTKPNVFGK